MFEPLTEPLFIKTFAIIGGMFFVSSMAAFINKKFETKAEENVAFIALLGFLFSTFFWADEFPVNIILIGAFSLFAGWNAGPLLNVLKGAFIGKKKKKKEDQKTLYQLIFQIFFTISLSILITVGILFFTDAVFNLLEVFGILITCLFFVMLILNRGVCRTRIPTFLRTYIGSVVFSIYLLFDFNYFEAFLLDGRTLDTLSNNEVWEIAIQMAAIIYVKIIIIVVSLGAKMAEAIPDEPSALLNTFSTYVFT